ncbi:UNVERIFIED_CONTAM: hypothetical protein GTU68_023829 [Idotea baltica]|nr:hypothetical protein [Idotea baltica]
MKLEGIDPQHQSLFCVMTVADVVGPRVRLHIDGCSDLYDFWCNANSPNLFPVGWCERNGRPLETPVGIANFSWKAYLEHCQACPAPRQAFATRNCSTTAAAVPPSSFRIGMKLEAEDRKNGWTCVATVGDLIDGRVLVHFDGWDKAFDAWFDAASPFIHPVGWCAKNGVYLYPPKDYPNSESFNWPEYLQETNSTGVPARAFKTRAAREFRPDMKVEAVDKRNPMLARVATIADTSRAYKVLLHFDGWPDMYDYWVDDDSPDLHPPTWCAKTGHPLQPPLTPAQCAEDVDSGVGCGTPGCKGYGHVKGLIYSTHHTAYGCPYSLQNLSKDWEAMLPDRLEPLPKERRKPLLNLDASKPVPDDLSEDSQRKRVRKRRKFFDELSPPEGASKTKMARVSSDEFAAKAPVLFKPSLQGAAASGASLSSVASGPSGAEGGSASKRGAAEATAAASFEEVSVDTMVHQSIFNPGYHPNPPPPVPHTLERHKHIISGLKLVQRSELDRLGPKEVQEAVARIPGCEASSAKFVDQDIDGESLLMLTQNDLVGLLKMKLGPAIKVMAMIVSLKNMP